jgi:hypothetical protein
MDLHDLRPHEYETVVFRISACSYVGLHACYYVNEVKIRSIILLSSKYGICLITVPVTKHDGIRKLKFRYLHNTKAQAALLLAVPTEFQYFCY